MKAVRKGHLEPTRLNDFCSLSHHVIDFPSLQSRTQKFFEHQLGITFCLDEAVDLLNALRVEDAKLVSWPQLQEHREAYTSLPLHHCSQSSYDPPLYPKRIDIYRNGTAANMMNSWRLIRIDNLARISRIGRLIAQHDNPGLYVATATSADSVIGEYIDDLCCR